MENAYPPGSYIERIEIDDLFGEKRVRLVAGSNHDPRILVVLGNNGAGKTTVLNIVRSLLTAQEYGGHRTRLTAIPFSRAAVYFSGGGMVEAKKLEGVSGGFDLIVRRSAEADSLAFKVRPRHGRVAAEDFEQDQRKRFHQVLRDIGIMVPAVSYLDDKRTFSSAEVGLGAGASGIVTRVLADGTKIKSRASIDRSENGGDPVQEGLEELVHSVRREALLLSKRGDQDAQSIYTSLVKGVSTFTSDRPLDKVVLYEKLRALQARSEALSTYGIFSKVNHGEMLEALSQVDGQGAEIASAVLGSYLDSLSVRLDAVETLHREISSWINNMNQFISPKGFEFRISDGFNIVSQSGQPLSVSVLSSGERHLLHMMTRAFLLRTTGGVLIVDEPELSLNWNWQRSLISSLVDAFGSSSCQLLVASHSLEICSQYQNALMELH